MRRLVVSVVGLFLPVLMVAQVIDTATVFYENFDNSTINVMTSTMHDGTGDWKPNAELYVSSPKSYHTPVYMYFTPSVMYFDVDLTNTSMMDSVRKFYLEFDHICKVDKLDEAYIYISKASSLAFTGQPNWGNPIKLTFNQASACYLSAGTMNPGGTVNSGAADFSQAGLGSGQFAANWYPSG
ncbi:MAG: hypothetical protein K5846_07275, partial [Bacteroidales bacterium]|nr:hypothetical protein [Bacteroidales bacterium]